MFQRENTSFFLSRELLDTCGKQMAGNSIHIAHINDRFTSFDYCSLPLKFPNGLKLFVTDFHFGLQFHDAFTAL